MAPAPFVSLDGLDGCGKTTQCRLLAAWLRGRGYDATECADPGGTPAGDAIRDLVLHRRQQLSVACEAFLFMASRAQLTSEIIQPALARGRAVVADRYLLANVVYQGHAGGLEPDQLWEIGRLATQGLEPDLTVVLDLPVEVARARRAGIADRMESRGHEFHARVRAGYLEEAQRRPDRIRVVDATLSVDAVHERICEEVAGVLAANPRA
ncbi:MAG TPA: dTMP kinase [Gemmataceae bacterium]|jgi:dTMP kinase|nr:dTMP kinase [Gemmataceae bacterium]